MTAVIPYSGFRVQRMPQNKRLCPFLGGYFVPENPLCIVLVKCCVG